MEILMDVILLVFWNLLIPVLIGYLVTKFVQNEVMKNNIPFNFVIGLIVMMGIFQPITLIGIYLKISLSFLTLIIKITWAILSVLSLILNRKRFILCICDMPSQIKKNCSSIIVIAVILFLVQIYVYVAFEHIDDDDAFFVATATTAVANNNLYINNPYTGGVLKSLPTRYILSPFSIYYAVMSQLIGTHPTVFAHLFLPLILLTFVYMVYYLWGKEWFQNKKSIGIFLIILSFLNIFGNYTEYTTQTFLLSRLWQGKAFLAAGIIPFVIYVCFKIRKEERHLIYWAILLSTTSAATLVSSMGVFLVPVAIGCFAFADCIQSRHLKRLIGYAISCLPCMICGIIYLFII